jgi:hypothetical protein
VDVRFMVIMSSNGCMPATFLPSSLCLSTLHPHGKGLPDGGSAITTYIQGGPEHRPMRAVSNTVIKNLPMVSSSIFFQRFEVMSRSGKCCNRTPDTAMMMTTDR